jgi:hypothetical protein
MARPRFYFLCGPRHQRQTDDQPSRGLRIHKHCSASRAPQIWQLPPTSDKKREKSERENTAFPDFRLSPPRPDILFPDITYERTTTTCPMSTYIQIAAYILLTAYHTAIPMSSRLIHVHSFYIITADYYNISSTRNSSLFHYLLTSSLCLCLCLCLCLLS